MLQPREREHEPPPGANLARLRFGEHHVAPRAGHRHGLHAANPGAEAHLVRCPPSRRGSAKSRHGASLRCHHVQVQPMTFPAHPNQAGQAFSSWPQGEPLLYRRQVGRRRAERRAAKPAAPAGPRSRISGRRLAWRMAVSAKAGQTGVSLVANGARGLRAGCPPRPLARRGA
jgi:hypothetical protein